MTVPLTSVPLPPEGPNPYCELVRAVLGVPRRLVSRTSHVVGVYVHWMGGRTHPCLRPDHPCPGCGEDAPRRWKGYLLGYDARTRVRCLIELPPLTVRAYEQLWSAATDLNGQEMTIIRRGPKPNSVVDVVFGQRQVSPGTAIPEADVLAALWRVLHLGSAPPAPIPLPDQYTDDWVPLP